MDRQEYTLEKISYSRKEDCRIMKSVLNGWFKDPKTLNLVSSNLTFPFNFKEWVSKNYSCNPFPTISLVIKNRKWILGHISLRVEKKTAHMFHLIIDEKFRRKGLAKKLLAEIESYCLSLEKTITLNVSKKNTKALNLYNNLGYIIKDEKKKQKNVKMQKF